MRRLEDGAHGHGEGLAAGAAVQDAKAEFGLRLVARLHALRLTDGPAVRADRTVRPAQALQHRARLFLRELAEGRQGDLRGLERVHARF